MHSAMRSFLRTSSCLQAGRRFAVSRRFNATYPPNITLEGERVIYSKLKDRFNPTLLSVQDVSGTLTCFVVPDLAYPFL